MTLGVVRVEGSSPTAKPLGKLLGPFPASVIETQLLAL